MLRKIRDCKNIVSGGIFGFFVGVGKPGLS